MKFPIDLVARDERRTALEKALCLIPNEHRAKESALTVLRHLLGETADTVRPLLEKETMAVRVLGACLGNGQGEGRYLLEIARNCSELANLAAECAHFRGIDTSSWPIERPVEPHLVFKRVTLPVPPLKSAYATRLDQTIARLEGLASADVAGALEQLGELIEIFRQRRSDIGLDAFQHFADEPEVDIVLRPYASRIWAAVRRLASPRPSSDRQRELRRAAVFFLAEAYQFSSEGLRDEDRTEIREFIASEIAAMRQLCKAGDRSAFSAASAHFHRCISVAMSLNGLGYGLRQTALCLRWVPEPAIRDNLQVSNTTDSPIDAWSAIPAAMIYTLHRYATKEETKDPLLKDARAQLAEFCLDRLKYAKPSAGAAAQPMEKSEHWRAACISALQDLRSNPQGMGHRTLHWVSEHDPNEDLRKLARSAYTVIRHNAGLGPGASARKALVSAVVWLLSGHLYALGHEISYDSVSEVVLDLVRRTTAPKNTSH